MTNSIDGSDRVGLDKARRLQQTGEMEAAEKICRDRLATESEFRPEFALLLAAILLIEERETEYALKLLADNEDISPSSSAATSDLGLVLFLAGNLSGALTRLSAAVASPDADAAAYNRLGALYLLGGNLDDSEKAFREAVLRDPSRAEVQSNLAGILVRQQKLDEALAQYDHALSLNSELQQAIDGRAAALIALDRIDEAIDRFREELAADPDSLTTRRRLARILTLDDRYQEAEDQLREIITREPEDMAARGELTALLYRQDRYIIAYHELKNALEVEPENIALLSLLARTQVDLRRFDEARDSIATVTEIDPQAPDLFIARADLAIAEDAYDTAEELLRESIDLYPGSAELLSQLGFTLLWIGKLDEAIEMFERAAQLNPSALAALVHARRFPEDPEVVDRMATFAANPLVPTEARSSMNFALATLYENKKDFGKAFEHVNEANGLTQRIINYEPGYTTTRVDAILRMFDRDLFERCLGMGSESERPVFVCGMPRSGTTLAEQVLASHDDVFGAGELGFLPAITGLMPTVLKDKRPYPLCMPNFTSRTAEHAAAYYLEKIAEHDTKAARVVDKLPHNFMQLGLIAILFPRAKIIHLNRDPRDTAVSNYFQNFAAKRGGMGYAFNLENIGHMLNDHDRMMAHWHEVLPIPIYELSYEALVDDPEPVTQALFEFIGLPWQKNVLEFHKTERAVRTASVWQVRQPIYTSSKEKWRRYEDHLGPLNNILGGTVAESSS